MPFVVATLDSFTQNAAMSQTAGGVVKSASADVVTLTEPSSTVRRSSVTDFSAPPLTASVPAPVLYSVDWSPSTTLSTLLTTPSGTSTTPSCLYPTATPSARAGNRLPDSAKHPTTTVAHAIDLLIFPARFLLLQFYVVLSYHNIAPYGKRFFETLRSRLTGWEGKR